MKALHKLIKKTFKDLKDPSIPITKRFLNLYKKNKEVINYLIVGGLTTLVSIGSYALIRIFLNNYIICTVLSWVIAVLFAYVTNRIFVFESKNNNIFSEIIKFISCRLLTLGNEVLIMWLLVDLITINDMIAKIIVQFITVVLNYVLSKIIVFRNK